jgi:hypothetical protein
MSTTRATIWIVGDWRHADFATAIAWLHEAASCECFDDPEALLAGTNPEARERNPAAILLVQSRPSQLNAEDVERLHSAAPLARLVALVGPWCEGEMRSGRPWPGVLRVSWRAWQSRLPLELSLVGLDGAAPAPLPRTATEAERSLASVAAVAANRRFRGNASVWTNDRTTFEALADALRSLGMNAAWHCGSAESGISPELMICDGWEQIPVDEPTASTCILLLHFPRPDDVLRARSRGIAAVVAQPLILADLAAAIESASSITLTTTVSRK